MNEQREIRLEDISALSIVTDVLRNFWVIILAIGSVWMGVSAYAKITYVPEYQSTATLVISSKGETSAFSSLDLTSEMASVFAEVFQSDILREKVAEEMGMETLSGKVTTQVIPETNLLRVSVISDSPEESFRTLDLILDNYHLVSDYLFGNAILSVIKEPDIPLEPCNGMPGAQKKALYALGGGFLVFIIIVLFSVLRDTVQTPQAAKHKLDGAMLGIISHEEKNKTKRLKKANKNSAVLITNPLASFAFQESYQNLCGKLDYWMRKKGQKVLVVTSASENEGKSTMSANIALALAGRKRKVLLVDCDLKKPAIQKIFGISKETGKSFIDYLRDDEIKDESSFIRQSNGITVAANQNGTKHSQKLIVSDKMKNFIEKQRQQVDYIILDSPPMLITSDVEALAQLADVTLLVVRQDYTMVSDINDCINLLQQKKSDFAGYVLNDYREIFSDNRKISASNKHGSHRY